MLIGALINRECLQELIRYGVLTLFRMLQLALQWVYFKVNQIVK